MNVMKNPWSIKNSPHAVRTLGSFDEDQRARPSRSWTGHPLGFQRVGWAARLQDFPKLPANFPALQKLQKNVILSGGAASRSEAAT